MIRRIDHRTMGKSDRGWLRSLFHFSFAEYYNAENIEFGVLRVLNDDLIDAGYGFDLHPHSEMEIISYVIDGELTHGDNLGNKNTIRRGEVQYMSAGTGIMHSESNNGDETLRLIQIWIYPDKKGYPPNYGDHRFDWDLRKNKWLHMVSPVSGDAPVKIHQDANIYAIALEKGKESEFEIGEGRQAYFVQIEGMSEINGTLMDQRDAAEVVEENISIIAKETSHILIIEMQKA